MGLLIRAIKKFFIKNYKVALDILTDKNKIEALLNAAEKQLDQIPAVGKNISNFPVFLEMLNSYFHKEYKDFNKKTLVTIVLAIIYFVSPLDVIFDKIPILGKLDDELALSMCYKAIEQDVAKYKEWKERNNKKKPKKSIGKAKSEK